jgi:hypothetical protein
MPIYKINGENPWTALKNRADKLTPSEFDFCVHEDPWTAVEYCAKKLNDEQKKFCAEYIKERSIFNPKECEILNLL